MAAAASSSCVPEQEQSAVYIVPGVLGKGVGEAGATAVKKQALAEMRGANHTLAV